MIEYPFIQGLSTTARWRAIEFIGVAFAAALVAAVPDLPYALGILAPRYSSETRTLSREFARLGWSLACNLYFVPLVIGALAIAHVARRREAFFAATLAWALCLAAALHWLFDVEMMSNWRAAIEKANGLPLPDVPHGLLVPFWAVSWRKLAQFALPLALGLAASGRKLSLPRFIASYLFGCAIVFPLLHWDLLRDAPDRRWVPRILDWVDWENFTLSPLARPLWTVYLFESFAQLLLAMLLLLPRLNREALGRHFGIGETPRAGFAARALATLNLALLLALAAFFARFGRYEAKLARFLMDQGTTDAPPGSRANAFFALAPAFESGAGPELCYVMTTSGTAAPRATATRRLVDIVETGPIYGGTLIRLLPLGSVDEAVSFLDQPQIAKIDAAIAPFYAAIDRCRETERLDVPTGRRLDESRFQWVIVGFCRRTAIRIHKGDSERALGDIETLVRLGAAMEGSSSVSLRSMGSVWRTYGRRLAFRYWQTYRRDPHRLRGLEETMRRLRPVNRRRFDPGRLAKASHLSWPMVPYYEAHFLEHSRQLSDRGQREGFDSALAEHDQLECALALERFKQAEGRYPERLAELAPSYLDAAPREPSTGLEMHYENLGDEFRLCRVAPATGRRREERYVGPGLPFPPPTKLDSWVETEFANARKAKAAAGNGAPTSGPDGIE